MTFVNDFVKFLRSRYHVPETFPVETETETETFGPETETRPRRLPVCPRRDRDETLGRLETVSRPRRRDRDYIPASKSFTC